jgi:hypothetical protein
MTITVTYSAVDGVYDHRRYATLRNARTFAHKMVGHHPELGRHYAVSGDGIGKIAVAGCTLNELFPMETTNMTTETNIVEETAVTTTETPKAKAPRKAKAVVSEPVVETPAVETPAVETPVADKPITLAEARRIAKENKTDKIKAAPKAPKVKEVKPEPVVVTFEGYELAEGADHATVFKGYQDAAQALDAIGTKDKALVGSYLALGEFQSKVAPLFKSTKIYGQFLKDKLPASQSLDPALRSNCKWLFENMTDVLSVLKLNQIEDYKSANPTVIKRDFKAAQALAEKQAKAEELGTDVEGVEAQEKAQTEAEKAEAQRRLDDALSGFAERLKGSRKQDKAEVTAALLKVLIGTKDVEVAITKITETLA